MLRFILVAILIFLLIRTFALYNREEEKEKCTKEKMPLSTIGPKFQKMWENL